MTIEDQIVKSMIALGWTKDDDIRVEIGGVSSSGIHQTEGANPKWAPPYGEVRYQNDAFIVLKNRSRSPVIPSKQNAE